MAFQDVTDPSSEWMDDTNMNADSLRHTYGAEYGKTTRILMGDHVRIGGLCFGPLSDPSNTQTDVTDPTDSWSNADDPSSSWVDAT